MVGEGMQVSCTLYFRGSKRYRLIFEKGIKEQSLINIQGWALNLNCSNKQVKSKN